MSNNICSLCGEKCERWEIVNGVCVKCLEKQRLNIITQSQPGKRKIIIGGI